MSEVPLDLRWERAPESPARVQSDAGRMFVGILTTSTRPFSSLRWLTRPERVNQRQLTSPRPPRPKPPVAARPQQVQRSQRTSLMPRQDLYGASTSMANSENRHKCLSPSFRPTDFAA